LNAKEHYSQVQFLVPPMTSPGSSNGGSAFTD